MAEKRQWTMVSSLVGEITFGVSGGQAGEKGYIPSTNGFVIRVTYTNESEKMKEALNSTRIAVQNTIRNFYRKNGKFPFAPGKVQNVSGTGEFTLPVEAQAERLINQMSDEDKRRFIAQLQASLSGASAPVEHEGGQGIVDTPSDGTSDEYKYNEDELEQLPVMRIKVLAQKEGLMDYDNRTREDLVEELALVLK